MVLTAAPRSPWSTGLVSLHREWIIFHSLDPSVGGTGPHGLTVRTTSQVWRRDTSIASRTTKRDDRESPLLRAGLLMNSRISGKGKGSSGVGRNLSERIESKWVSRRLLLGVSEYSEAKVVRQTATSH